MSEDEVARLRDAAQSLVDALPYEPGSMLGGKIALLVYALSGVPEGAAKGVGHRFDHDGTARHHHDVDTGQPTWWLNCEQFGGERREHHGLGRLSGVPEGAASDRLVAYPDCRECEGTGIVGDGEGHESWPCESCVDRAALSGVPEGAASRCTCGAGGNGGPHHNPLCAEWSPAYGLATSPRSVPSPEPLDVERLTAFLVEAALHEGLHGNFPSIRAQAEWMVAEWSDPKSLTNLRLAAPQPVPEDET